MSRPCSIGLIVSLALAWVSISGQSTKPDEKLKALRQAMTRPARYGLPEKSHPSVERLVAIGSTEAVRVLYDALTDPRVSRKVKIHALPALGRIGTKDALKAYSDYQAWASKFPPQRAFRFGPHENPIDHFADQDLKPLVRWNHAQREWAVFVWRRYAQNRIWLVSRKPRGPWGIPGLVDLPAGDAEKLAKEGRLTAWYKAGRLTLKGAKVEATVAPREQVADADKDGVVDAVEEMLGTDAKKRDTDADGIPDGKDSNPLTARPNWVSEDMEIRQAAFLALFGTSGTADGVNVAWDAGANRLRRVPDWARQEYYGMSGYVLRSQRIREGWVNITGIKLKRKSPIEALVIIHDWEGAEAASTHEIVVMKLQGVWVPVSVRMTIIS